MTPCLTEQQLKDLAAGEPDTADVGTLKAHLETCSGCRELLEEWRANLVYARDLKLELASGNSSVLGSPGETLSLARDYPEVPSDPETPPSIPGYSIIREIHRGGQGVVYEAVQLATRRTVAVKVLLEGPFAGERAKWRFEREVKLIAALKHPNIVIIHDSGIIRGRYYFAMDYVRGQPLDTHVRLATLSVRPIVRLFKQVVAAVAYAHRRGVIHRDLKPSNILVSEEGIPCVLDFGLAKTFGDQIAESQAGLASMPGVLMGTLRYMSPEQTGGDPDGIDVRTDVYTLGVILYELLTVSPPYRTAGDLSEALKNIREMDPPRPSKLRKEVHSELDAIVLKAMAKEPERRYQSVGEFEEDLGAWLDGRPVAAKSASSFYVLRKLAFRHGFESLVILAMVLAIGSIGTIAFQMQLRARDAVVQQQQSEKALADKDLGLAEFQRDALRLQNLAWFLLEWEGGRLDRAREHQSKSPADSPERVAMSFLLDASYTPDQLLADLPEDARCLAYFAIGERYAQSGSKREAVAAFESSIAASKPKQMWLKQAAEARVRQLLAGTSRPAQAEMQNQLR